MVCHLTPVEKTPPEYHKYLDFAGKNTKKTKQKPKQTQDVPHDAFAPREDLVCG
jgi:hypothetical protein